MLEPQVGIHFMALGACITWTCSSGVRSAPQITLGIPTSTPSSTLHLRIALLPRAHLDPHTRTQHQCHSFLVLLRNSLFAHQEMFPQMLCLCVPSQLVSKQEQSSHSHLPISVAIYLVPWSLRGGQDSEAKQGRLPGGG